MKVVWKLVVTGLALLILPLLSAAPEARAEITENHDIREWQFRWEPTPSFGPGVDPKGISDQWVSADKDTPVPDIPHKFPAAWIKFDLPKPDQAAWKQPGLFIDKLYGHHIVIYAGDRVLFESSRPYSYDVYKLALPLDRDDLGETVYVLVETLSDRIGLHQTIKLADYERTLPGFFKNDLFDMMLGGSLVFFSVIMLICSVILKKSLLSKWLSLSIVILTIGALIVTYSPFVYTFLGKYGQLSLALFDLALYVFLPTLTLFIEKALESPKRSLLTRCRKLLTAFSVCCLLFMVINEVTNAQYINFYYFFTGTLLGYVMLIQFTILISTTVIRAFKGNKDAVIMSTGFAVFAATGIGELIWFYANAKNYELFLWKWGVVCFVIAFIIILARQFAKDHEKVVNYTKELELYNNRLQKHEKMEIISELAASVAHEVRNPLQVTRGFLQLLSKRAENSEKTYMNLALVELDRASDIITDFLTFAKPQLDDIKVLNLSDEFKHIVGILAPMAHLQGGEIRLHIPEHLYIRGNSAKFKQAFVNIIKNSIEALEREGLIEIQARTERETIIVHVRDNGQGMEDEELSRLGEPYFSSKTKGTGLGLMVTFRIIEVMQGKIEFKSKKGAGTEAIVRFPSVSDPV